MTSTKSNAIKGAATLFANPAFQWLALLIGFALVIVYLIPWVVKKTFGAGGAVSQALDGARSAFSSTLDSAAKGFTQIVAAPTDTQVSADRKWSDGILGVPAYTTGDRALSDLKDAFSTLTGWFAPAITVATATSDQNTFTGTAEEYRALLHKLGYMDANENFTPAYYAAKAAGTVPKMPNT